MEEDTDGIDGVKEYAGIARCRFGHVELRSYRVPRKDLYFADARLT